MAPSAYHHRAPETGMEGIPNIPSQAAEEVGFEPTTGRDTPGNRLAGGRTRPTMRLLQDTTHRIGRQAEGVGFEPTRRASRLVVFKTTSLSRSDTPPIHDSSIAMVPRVLE